MLEVSGVTKRFGSFEAVADVSFSVERGEIVALTGPNGAGKTTLVSVISGLTPPDGGEVSVGGFRLKEDGAAARALLAVAAQDVALLQTMTVRANLRFFASLAGGTVSDTERRLADVSADLGIADLLEKKVLLLSGGQQRRVHVAAALVARPQLLVVDEPTAGADIESREAILGRMLRERDGGTAVVYTTHAMDEVASLDARVLILERGRLVADASVERLVREHAQAGVEVRFAHPPTALPEELRAGLDGAVLTVKTDDPTTTVGRILDSTAGSEILAIDIVRPGLEAAFLALTGRRFDGIEPALSGAG